MTTNVTVGLSELSRQLRLLQATNTRQAGQIDRLERQLRIASDLKGISVSDLRAALLEACRGEAHAELLSTVAQLRAELDCAAARAGGPPEDGASSGSGGDRAQSRSSFERESASRALATLELRVGELEEVEEALKNEVKDLYGRLSAETARAAKAESTCASLQEDLDKQRAVTKWVDTERQPGTDVAVVQDTDSSSADVEETNCDGDRDRDRDRDIGANDGGHVRKTKLHLQLYNARAKLLEEQLSAREDEADLRIRQFDARFRVQNERIKDLEQQLSSLYTAHEVLQRERTLERDREASWRSNLSESDSRWALRVDDTERSRRMLESDTRLAQQLSDRQLAEKLQEEMESVEGLPPESTTLPSSSFLQSGVDGIHASSEGWDDSEAQLRSDAELAKKLQDEMENEAQEVPTLAEASSLHLSGDGGLPASADPIPVAVCTPITSPPNPPLARCVSVSPASTSSSNLCVGGDAVRYRGASSMTAAASPTIPPSHHLVSGYLLKRCTNGLAKTWKKKFFVLHGSLGSDSCQLSYGDGPGGSMSSRAARTMGPLLRGVSSVTRTQKFANSHPFAFALYVNLHDSDAPVLYAAASSWEELGMWMDALAAATTDGRDWCGRGDGGSGSILAGRRQSSSVENVRRYERGDGEVSQVLNNGDIIT